MSETRILKIIRLTDQELFLEIEKMVARYGIRVFSKKYNIPYPQLHRILSRSEPIPEFITKRLGYEKYRGYSKLEEIQNGEVNEMVL